MLLAFVGCPLTAYFGQSVRATLLEHVALAGPPSMRLGRARAWVAVLRAHCTIRHASHPAVHEAIRAGADRLSAGQPLGATCARRRRARS